MVMCVLGAILVLAHIAKPEAGHPLLAFGPIASPLRHALIAILAVLLTLGTYFGRELRKVPHLQRNSAAVLRLLPRHPGSHEDHRRNTNPSRKHSNCTGGVFRSERRSRSIRNFPWVRMPRETSMVGSPAIDVVERLLERTNQYAGVIAARRGRLHAHRARLETDDSPGSSAGPCPAQSEAALSSLPLA